MGMSAQTDRAVGECKQTTNDSGSTSADANGGDGGLSFRNSNTVRNDTTDGAASTAESSWMSLFLGWWESTIIGANTLAIYAIKTQMNNDILTAMPTGLLMDATVLKMARSLSPHHLATNRVGHDRMATCAAPQTAVIMITNQPKQ